MCYAPVFAGGTKEVTCWGWGAKRDSLGQCVPNSSPGAQSWCEFGEPKASKRSLNHIQWLHFRHTLLLRNVPNLAAVNSLLVLIRFWDVDVGLVCQLFESLM